MPPTERFVISFAAEPLYSTFDFFDASGMFIMPSSLPEESLSPRESAWSPAPITERKAWSSPPSRRT